MKTLTKNNLSIYLFDNSRILNITTTDITVGNPPEFIISDCNSSNTVLHENVATPPEDWTGGKYFYDSGVWTINPFWVDPELTIPASESTI